MTLQEIRETINKVKADISRKEGEKSVLFENLKKEFNLKTLDEAFDLHETLKTSLQETQKEKEKLMNSVQDKLKEYGY